MVQKIQALQKRLIAKTEEVVEKDLLIQEKDKLYGTVALNAFANAEWSAGICRFYLTSRTLASASRTVELKNILARQPGPEVAEQLSIYQQGLRDKTKSMKAMASELNMYQAQVSYDGRSLLYQRFGLPPTRIFCSPLSIGVRK